MAENVHVFYPKYHGAPNAFFFRTKTTHKLLYWIIQKSHVPLKIHNER